MKYVRNLEEFYRKNDKDLTNILTRKFYKTLKSIPLEDLKSELYLRMQQKKYIENYRPFIVEIDVENGNWAVKSAAAKFSTYICKFVFNYIFAFHKKSNKDSQCISLDSYDDHEYCEENGTTLKRLDDTKYEPTKESDFLMQVQSYLKKLESKRDRGAVICDTPEEEKIVELLEKENCCSEASLVAEISGGFCEATGLGGLIKDQIVTNLKSIEKKGIIKKNAGGYSLDRPYKRSLYNLFMLYLEGYKDKEISEKFKITVAGVGAMKRSLRKELQRMVYPSKYDYI